METRELVGRAASGDDAAMRSLLVRHLPAIEAYVRLQAGALVRARESTSDLVQSVCAEVLQNLEGFEWRSEGQFRHWLCQHALHKILNKKRYYTAGRRDAAREVAPRASGDGAPSVMSCYATVCTPSRVAAGVEAVERFETAFAQLPDHYREVITLHRVVGLSFAEIAEQTGRAENAARNLFHRAVARLSSALEE